MFNKRSPKVLGNPVFVLGNEEVPAVLHEFFAADSAVAVGVDGSKSQDGVQFFQP